MYLKNYYYYCYLLQCSIKYKYLFFFPKITTYLHFLKSTKELSVFFLVIILNLYFPIFFFNIKNRKYLKTIDSFKLFSPLVYFLNRPLQNNIIFSSSKYAKFLITKDIVSYSHIPLLLKKSKGFWNFKKFVLKLSQITPFWWNR